MAISGRADYRAMGGYLGVAIGPLLGRGDENVDVGRLQSGLVQFTVGCTQVGAAGGAVHRVRELNFEADGKRSRPAIYL
jgi:hypothetical protein